MASPMPAAKLVAMHIGELGLTQRSPTNKVMHGGATVMLIFRRIKERGFGDPFSHSSSSLSLLHELEEPRTKSLLTPLEEPRSCRREEEEREEEKKKGKKKEERALGERKEKERKKS